MHAERCETYTVGHVKGHVKTFPIDELGGWMNVHQVRLDSASDLMS